MVRREKNWNRVGANFELQIMHDLSRYGYTVMRSSGSRGKVDVHAVGDGAERLYIQAKITNPLISPAERIALIDVAGRAHGHPVVAYRINGHVAYRELTGTGPKAWRLYEPNVSQRAECGSCGHVRNEHAPHGPLDSGCWHLPAAGPSCACPTFQLQERKR